LRALRWDRRRARLLVNIRAPWCDKQARTSAVPALRFVINSERATKGKIY